jgi:uncharacterized protein YbjT (DUF2867 family)
VLVLGSTGGVGQIVTAKLLERGYSVRATTRDEAKAKELFGGAGEALDIFVGDTRKAESLTKALEGALKAGLLSPPELLLHNNHQC